MRLCKHRKSTLYCLINIEPLFLLNFYVKLVFEGKPLVDAIAVFKEKLDSCAQYSCDNNLKSVIDYVFLTYMYFQHYKLYQFVLTQDRADDLTKVHLVVEPPRAVPVMREAIPKSVWDEEQRIKQIDQMEQERKQVCFKARGAQF